MARRRFALLCVSGVLAAALAAPLAGQGQAVAIAQTPVPARDPVPPPARGTPVPRPPMERTMPVGSASITGVVTSGDSGRPVAGARVQLSGMAGNPAALEPVLTALRGAARGAPPPSGLNGSSPAPPTVTINGATVNLTQLSINVSRTVMTDAQGVFTIQRLPGGTFTLSVQKNQFLSTNYGQKRPGGQGTPIALADGQQLKLNVPMSRGGVILGQIFGQEGEPLVGAQVSAWRFQYTNGSRRIFQQNSVQTDDRGMYRLHGLQPGDYLISARPNNEFFFNDQMDAIENAIATGTVKPPVLPGLPSTVTFTLAPPIQGPIESPPNFLPTYYGGSTTRTGAQIIHVTGDDERIGTDIVVQLVRSTNVTGVIAMPPTPGVSVQLTMAPEDSLQPMNFGSTRVGPDGKFTFREVAPGKYTVIAVTVPAPTPPTMTSTGVVVGPAQVRPQLDDSQKMWGRSVINVNGESTMSVNMALQPARSISGVVISEMSRPPDFSRMQVMLTQAPGSELPTVGPQPSAQVSADGQFRLGGVTPGRYVLRVPQQMKSSIVEGQDSLDFPFEVTGDRDIGDAVITITDKYSELSGSLTEGGKPAVGYSIVAVSTDQRFWTPGSRRIVMTRPGMDGKFYFRNLPPGEYFLSAAAEFETGLQYDPEFLKSLVASAVRVTLMEGETRTQDLRVAIRR